MENILRQADFLSPTTIGVQQKSKSATAEQSFSIEAWIASSHLLQMLQQERNGRPTDISNMELSQRNLRLVADISSEEGYINAGTEHVVVAIDNKAVFAYRWRENLTRAEWEKMEAAYAIVDIIFPDFFPHLLGAVCAGYDSSQMTGVFRERVTKYDPPTDGSVKVHDFQKEVVDICRKYAFPLHFDLVGEGNMIPRLINNEVYETYVNTIVFGSRWNIDTIKQFMKDTKRRFTKDRQQIIQECIRRLL